MGLELEILVCCFLKELIDGEFYGRCPDLMVLRYFKFSIIFSCFRACDVVVFAGR